MAVNGVIVEKYLWQDSTTLLAVFDGSDNLIQRFEYADGRMPVSMVYNGSVYYLAYNQVGSLRIVTDSGGNIIKRVDYDSFGNILSDSNPTFAVPFGFAGGLHDRHTGFVRFGARDYDPATGKWTAKDPIDFAGGDLNLFVYTVNNPITFADPKGRAVFGAVYGSIVGGLSAYLGAKAQCADWEDALIAGLMGAAFGGAVGLFDPTEGIMTSMLLGSVVGGVANIGAQVAINLENRREPLGINYGSFAGSVIGGALGGGMGNIAKSGLIYLGAGEIVADIAGAAAGATQGAIWPLVGETINP